LIVRIWEKGIWLTRIPGCFEPV